MQECEGHISTLIGTLVNHCLGYEENLDTFLLCLMKTIYYCKITISDTPTFGCVSKGIFITWMICRSVSTIRGNK